MSATLALNAISWLGKVVSFFRKKLFRRTIKIRGLLEDLIELEEKAAADKENEPHFWEKLEQGAAAGKSVTFEANEVAYGHGFKQIFDRRLKKPLQKVTSKLELLKGIVGEDDE